MKAKRTRTWNATTKALMRRFDWKKTHKAMQALDWGWARTGGRVPTIPEMKETVEDLLNDAEKYIKKLDAPSDFPLIRNRDWHVATGGFRVTVYGKDNIELSFVVASWDEDREE